MQKPKICWVTPDWFVDVDMPIVPHLLDKYDITWIIFSLGDITDSRRQTSNT